MNGLFVDNVRLKFDNVLNSLILNSQRVQIAVAFVKNSGLRLIESALSSCIANSGIVEFIVGLDFHTTDAQSLRVLSQMAHDTSRLSLFCFSDPADNVSVYHPKLYLFEKHEHVKCIIGSSNLTQGGLRDNIEVNVMLEFEPDDANLETLRDIYAQIKYQPTRFIPDADYIAAYEDITRRINNASRVVSGDPGLKRELELLRHREQNLPKPFVAPISLQGWQKLVFEKIPNHEFLTNELYSHVNEFRQSYPENKNVEAKIRQVLQQLRDLGLIIHMGEGRWIKRS